jgi:small subunit ribosomal protein S2
MAAVSMRELIDAGAHFGHQTRYWSPRMAPFIYGVRQKIHIINLEKTVPLLDEALNFLGGIAAKKGKVLFVGTKRPARKLVAQYAEACAMPYVNDRWLGGMLTNHRTVRKSVDRLEELELFLDAGRYRDLSKKEVAALQREREKLARSVGGIRTIKGLPQALFVIDVGYEHIAVGEARKLGVPVVGIVDTNNTPDPVDYVIPGNDDSIRAIEIYLRLAADAIKNARAATDAGAGLDEFVELEEEVAG